MLVDSDAEEEVVKGGEPCVQADDDQKSVADIFPKHCNSRNMFPKAPCMAQRPDEGGNVSRRGRTGLQPSSRPDG